MPETNEAKAGAAALDERLAALYAREIAPQAEQLEAARRKRLRAFYLRIAVSLAVLLAAALVGYLAGLPERAPFLSFGGLVALSALALFWITRPVAAQRAAVREAVVGPLCRAIGELEHRRKPGGAFDLGPFRALGLVGGFSRKRLEDLFVGRHRGVGFRMVEARLSRGAGGAKRRVFEGLLFEIEVPRPFSGRLVLVGDKGALLNRIYAALRRRFGGLEVIVPGHPAFEARFEVLGDDPQAARDLLSPAFLDSMVALASAAGRVPPTAAFAEGRFLLALPHRRDLFEIGRLHRSLDHLEADLRSLADEVTTAHRVIDFLHGDRPPRLFAD